jgi:hypothetical protein
MKRYEKWRGKASPLGTYRANVMSDRNTFAERMGSKKPQRDAAGAMCRVNGKRHTAAVQ